MPKTYEDNQKIKEERRNNIIFTAIPVYFSKKRSLIKVDDITTAAGCSHGLFYHYFKNVDDLYNAIKNTPQISEIFHKINDSIFGNEYDSLYRITKYLLSQINEGSLNYIKFVINDEDFRKTLITLVGKGQKKKIITGGDPSEITTSYTAILLGIMELRTLDDKTAVPSIDIVMNVARKRNF